MEDPVLLLVGDTPDGGEEITPEHQVVEDISLVIRGVLPPDGVEILRVGARYILHQHIKLPRLPSIQEEASSAPDCDGSGHVLGALEDHRLEIMNISVFQRRCWNPVSSMAITHTNF